MVQRRRRKIQEPKVSKPVIHREEESDEFYKEDNGETLFGSWNRLIISITAVCIIALISVYIIYRNTGSEGEPEITLPPQPAAVSVLNGCGESGVAGRMADFLKENGIDVMSSENADNSDYLETIIIGKDSQGKHARDIAEIIGISNITYDFDSTSAANVVIILGKDYSKYSPFNR